MMGHGRGLDDFAACLHLSEQYLTSLQTFSHFFRHVNDNSQCWQVLVGRSDLRRIFMCKIAYCTMIVLYCLSAPLSLSSVN